MADPDSGAMPVDPYEAVLADLRAKRDDIDRLISTLESYRAGGSPVAPATVAAKKPSTEGLGPGAFLGMSIIDATKKLLAHKRRQMTNHEILAELKAGGLVMNAAEPLNVVGSILTRRFSGKGDVVRVSRGTWGLKEWYPNRSFKKDAEEAGAAVKEAPTTTAAEPEEDPLA